ENWQIARKNPPHFLGRGHRIDHGVRHRVAKALIIHKEKSSVATERSAERRSKIVLHQVIIAHRGESGRIHRSVSQELVNGTVVLVGARTRDNIDLATAGTTHFGGVAS